MDIKKFTSITERVCAYTGEVIAPMTEFYERVNGDVISISFYESNEDRFLVCEECGYLIDTDCDDEYYETSDGSTICEDCRDDYYFECYECGELHHRDDMVEVVSYAWSHRDTREVCEDCARYSGNYYQCDDCGTWRIGEPTVTHDDNNICEECLSAYERCADCNEVYPASEMRYDGWDWYCPTCDGRRVITGYHQHDRTRLDRFNLFGKIVGEDLSKPENKLLIGTETEVENRDRYNDTCNAVASEVRDLMGEHVHFEYDGSLDNGFEIISRPHTLRALKKAGFDKMFELLMERGYVSHDNENCGLHVHVSKEWFGDTDSEQKANVAKVLYLYSEKFEIFKTLARRESTCYCEKVHFDSTAQARETLWRATGHYVAINVQNMGDFGTVEFRLGRGTLNYDTYLAWIDICVALARNSKNVPDDCLDLNKWLKGITLETRGYILSRTGIVIDYSRRNIERTVA